MRLTKLIELCERYNACRQSVQHLRTCKTMKEAMAHPNVPAWACYARCYLCRDDTPSEAKRLAERMACRDAWAAYEMRACSRDLSDATKRKAEMAACRRHETAAELVGLFRRGVTLHPDTVARLRRMGHYVPEAPE